MSDEDPRVVTAVTTLAEAELVRNLLADHGIPVLIRSQSPIIGALQADGGQKVLVPAAAYDQALEILQGPAGGDELPGT